MISECERKHHMMTLGWVVPFITGKYSCLSSVLSVLNTLGIDLFPPINVVKTAFWEFNLIVSGEFNPFILIEIIEMFGPSLPFYFVSSAFRRHDWVLFFLLVFLSSALERIKPTALPLVVILLSEFADTVAVISRASPLAFLLFPTRTSSPGVIMWDLFQINLCYLDVCVCVCFNSMHSYLDNCKFYWFLLTAFSFIPRLVFWFIAADHQLIHQVESFT